MSFGGGLALHVPDSISPNWIKMVLRLQQIAKTTHVNSHKLMKASMIVDGDGNLMLWFEPDCARINPNEGAKEWINKLLT